MFTGLVEGTGRVARVEGRDASRIVRIDTPLAGELTSGDSIAVSGVCLTATTTDAQGFTAEVSSETMRVTSLGALAKGDVVNLERPVRADARLGGHFVLGHVDAVGRIAAIRPDGDCYWVEVEYPEALAPLIVSKGSVAVDGISLTVASLDDRRFGVQIVPFTWTHTTLQARRVGDAVNLETDIIGKYVRRLMSL